MICHINYKQNSFLHYSTPGCLGSLKITGYIHDTLNNSLTYWPEFGSGNPFLYRGLTNGIYLKYSTICHMNYKQNSFLYYSTPGCLRSLKLTGYIHGTLNDTLTYWPEFGSGKPFLYRGLTNGIYWNIWWFAILTISKIHFFITLLQGAWEAWNLQDISMVL